MMQQVSAVLSEYSVQDKVVDMFTYDDPAQNCDVQFKTSRAKIGFFKKTKGANKKWTSGGRMWWKNNDDIEKQVVDKLCGASSSRWSRGESTYVM